MRIIRDGRMEEEYAWKGSENGVKILDERESTHCAIAVGFGGNILVVLCD